MKELGAPTARVLRDGEVKVIPAKDVVTGDICFLESGDRVPADGELIEAEGLSMDESILTGESMPEGKSIEAGEDADMKIHTLGIPRQLQGYENVVYNYKGNVYLFKSTLQILKKGIKYIKN